ncbi:MAG: UDP-N-acetylmuramate dehydrogenase [Alphaproteobacteria bacterium]|nr:UDP-N-acetylmuramate dehydrogenase [Alphaproteobacteria bacterium]
MTLPEATLEALDDAGVAVQLDAPLVKRTWWRVGGTADALVQADDLRTACLVRRIATETGCPLFVLGNASNLLVADAGIRGIVVRLGGSLAQIEEEPATEPRIYAGPEALVLGAGLKLTVLVGRMLKNGWTGLELFAGIPGTVGGAVRMNAGTSLGEVVDALVDVEIVQPDGSLALLEAEALAMAYRTAVLPPDTIVVSARFRLTDADPEASRHHIEAHLERRKATQPIDQPSCGSTFRNPDGDHAGRLIEAAGLKGFTIGGAQVSEKHANFIVNTGDATATDIRAVIEHVQDAVASRFGVQLVREVHFAGDWSGWSP